MTTVASTTNVVRVRRIPAETILLIAVIVLVVAGVLIVFDASFPLSLESQKVGHDPFYFGKQQARGLIAGLLGMFAAIHFGYKKLRPWSQYIYGCRSDTVDPGVVSTYRNCETAR